MSKADVLFKKMCRDILENGTDTKDEKVRPHWPDGAPAYTIKKFCVVNEYDLRDEFPALTLRRTALKSAMDEMLWIWQKKSNNIHDLKSHIWDEWADQNGSIGKAYGYQQAKLHPYIKITPEGLQKAFPGAQFCSIIHDKTVCEAFVYGRKEGNLGLSSFDRLLAVKKKGLWCMTQIDKALYDLVNTPFSRRIIVDMWDPQDQHAMALTPCAYSVTFNVTSERGTKVLNMILNQRSQDILAANNWNVVQYSILLMMVARHVHMTPGKLVHVIADAHIYDRHVDIIKDLIDRKEYDAPLVGLNPDKHNFYDFTTDDLIISGYHHGEQIKNIPIAI